VPVNVGFADKMDCFVNWREPGVSLIEVFRSICDYGHPS